jgi:hypothetical protein
MTRAELSRRLPELNLVCPKNSDPEVEQVALDRLAAWLHRGYRFSLGHPCLDYVEHGRCGCARRGLAEFREYEESREELGRWADHVHRWRHGDGTHVLTAQPYDLAEDRLASLVKETAGRGLTYQVEPDGSWWYPGQTTLIVIRRRGLPLVSWSEFLKETESARGR